MFSGIMNKISQKVGGCSLQIEIVLASVVVQIPFWVLQIIGHGDHKFPFASDSPPVFIFYDFEPTF